MNIKTNFNIPSTEIRPRTLNIFKNKLNNSCQSLNKQFYFEIENPHIYHQNIKNIYSQNIEAFLNLNGENNINPIITISSKLYPQNEILSIKTMKHLKRIPILNGQLGIKSEINIPQYTIIGQYFGYEQTESQWLTKMQKVNEQTFKKHCNYIMSVSFNKKTINNMNNNNNYIFMKQSKILKIDPILYGNGQTSKNSKLVFINDCRKRIQNNDLTNNDKKIKNVQIVNGSVNKWPSSFMITTKKIYANNILWTDYGNLYHIYDS